MILSIHSIHPTKTERESEIDTAKGDYAMSHSIQPRPTETEIARKDNINRKGKGMYIYHVIKMFTI